MLSMRNGLNLQTMYLPGSLPALQSSHARMSLNLNDASLINMAVGMMPSSHDSSVQHSSFEISKQMIPDLPVTHPTTSLGIESSQFSSFPFPVPAEVCIMPLPFSICKKLSNGKQEYRNLLILVLCRRCWRHDDY